MPLEMGEETFTRSRNGREGDVDEERRLVRLLVGGGMIRRRRLRALLLAHLFREARGEEEGEEEGEREGGATDEERLSSTRSRGMRLRSSSSSIVNRGQSLEYEQQAPHELQAPIRTDVWDLCGAILFTESLSLAERSRWTTAAT
jgi:hypothetical protein